MQHLLKDFLQPEVVHCRCDNCAHANARVTSSISSLPRILCIHLNRFENKVRQCHCRCRGCYHCGAVRVCYGLTCLPQVSGISKLHTPISLPETLDLSQFSSQPQPTSGALYRLSSMVIHHGEQAGGGHYTTAVCRPCDKQWVEFNDEKVTVMGAAPDSCSIGSYLLFFKPNQQHATAQRQQPNKQQQQQQQSPHEQQPPHKQPPQQLLDQVVSWGQLCTQLQLQRQGLNTRISNTDYRLSDIKAVLTEKTMLNDEVSTMPPQCTNPLMIKTFLQFSAPLAVDSHT